MTDILTDIFKGQAAIQSECDELFAQMNKIIHAFNEFLEGTDTGYRVDFESIGRDKSALHLKRQSNSTRPRYMGWAGTVAHTVIGSSFTYGQITHTGSIDEITGLAQKAIAAVLREACDPESFERLSSNAARLSANGANCSRAPA